MVANGHWTDRLSDGVYARLCNCRTVKADIAELVDAKWRSYKENGRAGQGFTKEDALAAVLDMLDSNSCFFDLTEDEYNELCR